MISHSHKLLGSLLLIVALVACGPQPTATVITPTPTVPTATPTLPMVTPLVPTATFTPTSLPLPALSITLGSTNQSQGIRLDSGGDVDTVVASVGKPVTETRASGNNRALSAPDNNTTPDSYLQFNVDDHQLYNGKPSSHVVVEVDYYDSGSDTFSLQYDALAGLFAGGGSIVKTNSGTFKTARFNLCDANFANRDNGADFRLSDNGDGAEYIRAVRVIAIPSSLARALRVDDYGANPFDDQPDSEAIQTVLDLACSGDTIIFTSGVNTTGYNGYLIDQTLFLTGMSAKHDLGFTSSDPANHALLKATADLKGFVLRLYARSRFSNAGDIDNIDFGYIDVEGGRDARTCLGPDQQINGVGDNWGSWLPECTAAGDPWCSPGNLGMDGGADWGDVTQNYPAHPANWTTGVVVHDLVNKNAECGTALAFFSAGGTIHNVTIDTAGDHVHARGCAYTDNDGDQTGWSDGITLFGPGQTVRDNTIINPSDVGIVFFGGKNTLIANNTIIITAGNYGAFAGIALHPWILGDISGTQFTGNQVTSNGDSNCGGLHVGINIGPHMWGGGCVSTSSAAMLGNSGTCQLNPSLARVAACSGGACQLWAYIATSQSFTLQDNTVSGAQINYLVEGLATVGTFVDQNNVSQAPRLSDWQASRTGCNGVTWGALDKVAHDPSLPGYTDLAIHCER
jgi:hypothetical protein